MNTIDSIVYNAETRTTTRPAYYVWTDDGVDLWDTWGDRFGNAGACCACLSQVDKYLYRAGAKEGNPEPQELLKASRYFNKAIDYYYLTDRDSRADLCGEVITMAGDLIKRLSEDLGE